MVVHLIPNLTLYSPPHLPCIKTTEGTCYTGERIEYDKTYVHDGKE